jgi:hypothetical protein
MAQFEIPLGAMPDPAPAAPPPDPAMAREQAIADTTRAEEALNGFIAAKQHALFEAPDAFYRTQGSDAIHAAPAILDTLSKLRDDHLDGLANDAQRARLAPALDAHLDLARDDIARHVAEQSLAWQRKVAQDRIALLTKEAAYHHNDDDRIDAIGEAADSAARAHARVGDTPLDQEAEGAAAATARSGVLNAAILARLAGNDPAAAAQMLARVRDRLDPTHAEPLQAQVDAGLVTLLPYRPSPDSGSIAAVPLPYRPPATGELDKALILKNLANVSEDESALGQNNGEIVPVNATSHGVMNSAEADPQLAQAPSGDQPAPSSKPQNARLPMSENERDAAQALLGSEANGRSGTAPVVEPLPGSKVYRDAEAQVPEAEADVSPGQVVVLPKGDRIPDAEPEIEANRSPTDYMMSPVADLAPVAAAGRAVGERYRAIASVSPGAAELYLKAELGLNVATGGKFDYQRRGPQLKGLANEALRRKNVDKPMRDWVAEPFIQRRQFRSVSNFNVGLFCQQAGLSLERL